MVRFYFLSKCACCNKYVCQYFALVDKVGDERLANELQVYRVLQIQSVGPRTISGKINSFLINSVKIHNNTRSESFSLFLNHVFMGKAFAFHASHLIILAS